MLVFSTAEPKAELVPPPPPPLLQVDLLLGTWAEKNVPGLSVPDMDSYEDILNLETVDIFNFITKNAEPPAFVDTPMMARLQVRLGCFFERVGACGFKFLSFLCVGGIFVLERRE